MKDTLRDCIEGKSSYTPIWFMRQAGRYLPEFREIRKKNPDFIKLCLNPTLVNEITLQPLKRFDIDAAIIFSDILMIPFGLGQKVEFKKGIGPILDNFNFFIINSSERAAKACNFVIFFRDNSTKPEALIVLRSEPEPLINNVPFPDFTDVLPPPCKTSDVSAPNKLET